MQKRTLVLSPALSAAATMGVVAVDRKLKTMKANPNRELLTPSAPCVVHSVVNSGEGV